MNQFHNFENTVAVLFGGRSSEHEISLRSAVFIFKNIPDKYNIIPVGINRNGIYYSLEGTFKAKDFLDITVQDLSEIIEGRSLIKIPDRKNIKSVILPHLAEEIAKDFDSFPYRILNLEASCFFPVLHGQNGEDGRLQGLFELAEVAYVGCDIRASVVGIDKDIAKRLARDAGISIAKYEVVVGEVYFKNQEETLINLERAIGYPCFVKPNSLGSAVGTGRAKNRLELQKLLIEALSFDQKVLVEEPMSGTEVECAFLGTSAFPKITLAGEIVTKDFYSYEEKYSNASEATSNIPAKIDSERMQELKTLAEKIAKATGISGLCRIDFWNCKTLNRFVFNEINTLPGLTSISMFPKLWEYEGILGNIWIEDIIEQAYARRKWMAKSQYGIRASI
ncbi:D-alanine--D-alanine ligase family protein [Fluviispira multicolorata]|uniref:D-alanine--D-alanine ligase n=1 Tax=Fluviispira multicolorata TaxID=2654512 RepID=A0A833N6I5_9BACT|nr:D-alanine--D-alanine ligase family protein [Fluviispira multicolorata]KAB8033505.1 D-alanine--D-alanine ligase [Fluviispira multicolorata]